MKIRKKTLTCGARLSAATPPHAMCRVGQHCPLCAHRYKAPRSERRPCPKPRCLSQSTTSPPFLDEHHAAAVLPPLAQLATHLLLFPRKSTVSRATWFFIGEEPRHLPSSSLLGDPRAAAAVVVPNAYRTRLTLIPFRVQVIVVGIIEPPSEPPSRKPLSSSTLGCRWGRRAFSSVAHRLTIRAAGVCSLYTSRLAPPLRWSYITVPPMRMRCRRPACASTPA
jgi:hypothetical protein